MMRFVFAYDSPDDSRRTRIARALEEVADRVQYSVFEGWLRDDEAKKIMETLRNIVDPRADSVRVYSLCDYCLRRLQVLGPNPIERPPQYWMI